MTEQKFTFLIGSARRDGNSETLARRAAAALPPEADQQWLHHQDLPLPPFVDLRHGDIPFPEPQGAEGTLLDATLSATDLVFVAPLYWYGLPAATKLYLDYWSAWLRLPGRDFKARMAAKTFWAVTAISDDDDRMAEPLVGTLKLTTDYLGARWGGALLGHGNRPGEVLGDNLALEQARHFFVGRN
ncbi:MAG TPA: NAD(P)H-dependent oxidoreductase [Aliidongia sp.]|uniref:NAD(P)H-dependent oxidoreductase n=1 Tax=Aliidongia sp. TaxID=1914230 RepID=UPI002DDCC394|nr:NAD(P)H-dependent oxidoreductase [Aliidongia sp.]HEV2676246.1 NAD(P)H-dependent oxidoreductase [Aliidongia sp.]